VETFRLLLFALVFFISITPPVLLGQASPFLYETYGILEARAQYGPYYQRTSLPSEQSEIYDSAVSVGPAGNTAEAYYFANLATGSLGAYSYVTNAFDETAGSWRDARAQSGVGFKDTIYFAVPAGSYPEGLYVTVTGRIAGSISSTDTEIGESQGRSTWRVGFRRVTPPNPEDSITGDSGFIEDGATYSISQPFALTLPLVYEGSTLEEPSTIETYVYAWIGYGTTTNTAAVTARTKKATTVTDFSSTIHLLGLEVPEAVTWTSASGVFLTQQIESCDMDGVEKDYFLPDESVYVKRSGLVPGGLYRLYIVEDTTWEDGMDIVAETTVVGGPWDITGGTGPDPINVGIYSLGSYDVVLDSSVSPLDLPPDGFYDEGVDALDDMDVGTAGFFVVSGVPGGALAALVGFLAAALARRYRK